MPIFFSMEPQATRVALAERPVGADEEFRHDEERYALGARRRTLDARQHEVNDVLGEVVLARRNEDLGAGDRIGPVAVRDRLGLEEPEIRPAMRFGKVHGAGPGCRRPASASRVFFCSGEPCTKIAAMAPCVSPGYMPRARLAAETNSWIVVLRIVRQALAAIFGRGRKAHPAPGRIGPVGFLEAGRRRDRAVGVARAALFVADPVERGEELPRRAWRLR